MTTVVINDILPRTQAVASGGQTIYSTTWTANVATDVQVYSRPANTPANDVTQILSTSDYSVAFIGNDQTVQVTLNTPSTAGDIVTIIRNTPSDRLNFYSNTNFTPQMLNNDFGIMTMVDQQAQMVNQEIAPRYNYSELLNQNAATEDVILPLLGANQAWVKNAGNTAIVAVTIPPSGPAPSNSTYILESADTNLPNSYVLTQGTGIGFSLGTGTLTVSLSTPVSLTNGGTGSSLTATQNGIIYCGISGFAITAAAANSTLVTDGSNNPSLSQTLPSAVQTNITKLGTQSQALNMGSHLINNVTDPVSAQDACTKNYADNIAGGLNPIPGVAAASTTSLTVTYNNGTAGIGATLTNAGAQAAFAIDGYSASLNDRILIKNQSSTFQNGIYVVTTVGDGSHNWVLTRATNYDQPNEIQPGDLTVVENGTTNANSSWLQTATVITVGTSAITYSVFFSPSTYLIKANNLSDVANALTAFGNISPLTTKGDLLAFSTVNARLAVGSTNGQILQVASGNATGLGWSTPTYPSASGSAGKILRSDGTNNVYSTATYPDTAGSSGNVLTSNGTNFVSSSPSGTGTVQLISTGTASSSASISFTGLSSTYSYYFVMFYNVQPANNADSLVLQISTDNGSTYQTTSYYYGLNQASSNNTEAAVGAANTSAILISNSQANTGSLSGVIELYNPSQSSLSHLMHLRDSFVDSTGNINTLQGVGAWNSTTAFNAIKFKYNSGGNITSGVFKLYGVLA